jgi:hypothetical protein
MDNKLCPGGIPRRFWECGEGVNGYEVEKAVEAVKTEINKL